MTPSCGHLNQLCCNGVCVDGSACTRGTFCADANLACSGGICTAPTCGGLGQACCAGSTCTSPTSACSGGSCVPCGEVGAPCCVGNICHMGAMCNAGTCGVLVGTGEPCTKNTDCANGPLSTQKGTCLKTTGTPPNQLTWSLGYCASPCRPTKTDASGFNTDCPGDNGTCTDAELSCRHLCMSSADCRAGYACFVVNAVALGCLPSSISECDPTVAGSCPPVGGLPYTCVNIGDGTVGSCDQGCDPFLATGCTDAARSDCHASDLTGEGLCVAPGADAPAGGQCGNFYSDCQSGYGCLSGNCWKYCKTANVATQCSFGATCQPFSTISPVPTSVGGICSHSN